MNFSLNELKANLKLAKNKEEEPKLIENYIKKIEINKRELEKNYMSILELQIIYVYLCEVCLKSKKFEKALLASEKGLILKENEDLRAINYLCLKRLKFIQRSEESLKIGISNFPTNKLFQKDAKNLPIDKTQSKMESSNENLQMKNNLEHMKNLDQNQIESMVQKMRNNPESKLKMEQFYGRPISESEYENMLKMMNKDIIKESLNMYQNNPEMIRNMQQKNNTLNVNNNSGISNLPDINPNMFNPEMMKMATSMMKDNPELLNSLKNSNPNLINLQNEQITSMMTEDNIKMAMDMMKNNPDLVKNLQGRSNMGNMTYMGNMPNMNNMENIPNMTNMPPNMANMKGSILENKDLIKSGLKIFKDNPKQMLQMVKNLTNNPQIEKISEISEKKLKVMSNCLYYFVAFCLEAYSLLKKFKNEIILFLIFYFIYKIMG